MPRRPTATTSRRALAIAHGWRSGLEEAVAERLTQLGVAFEYETLKLSYSVEERRTYTPDFQLANGVIIETKGFWSPEDRKKMRLIKEQHPHLDIRFIFTRPSTRISKTSKTTYGDFAERLGFKWAKGPDIPKEWLDDSEGREPRSVCSGSTRRQCAEDT